MNTQIKWLSDIILIDAETSEVLSIDNTQVTAHQYLINHKLEITRKTSTAKINEHEKTAKRTIYWHCQPKKPSQFKLWK